MIELNRKNHLIDIRWLTSREILHLTGALMVSRLVLSEQTSGAINFLRNAGMLNEQMAGLYWVILAGVIASGVVCAVIMKPGRESHDPRCFSAPGGSRQLHGQPVDCLYPAGTDVS
jgi:hypothetical protein